MKFTKNFLEELKNKLEEEKRLLEEELASFAEKDTEIEGNYQTIFPDYGKSVGSQDENMDEVEEYDASINVEHTLELRLQEVNDALKRIKRKGYGMCANCKRPIMKERLLATPTAKTCIKCEA